MRVRAEWPVWRSSTHNALPIWRLQFYSADSVFASCISGDEGVLTFSARRYTMCSLLHLQACCPPPCPFAARALGVARSSLLGSDGLHPIPLDARSRRVAPVPEVPFSSLGWSLSCAVEPAIEWALVVLSGLLLDPHVSLLARRKRSWSAPRPLLL